MSGFLKFEEEDGMMDWLFFLLDFVIQISVAVIFTLNFLTKEGVIGTFAPETDLYLLIQRFGLTKTISLIAFFSMSHIN